MGGRPRTVLAVIAFVLLLAAACGDDSGDSSSTTTTEGSSETTAAPEETEDDTDGMVEESPVMAEFETRVDAADPASDPLFPPGTAQAWWYTAGDVYAVVYTGIDVDAVGLTCPGNSVELTDGSGFDFVSNAPLAEGDCGPVQVDPAAEARLCEGTIVYTTVIPLDTEGALTASFGAIEPGQGGGVGSVDADSTVAPELDPSADAYAFPDSMGGPVTC